MKTKNELRAIALGAARSILRNQGRMPEKCSYRVALAVLDDMARQEYHKDKYFAIWYIEASESKFDNQYNLFRKEWNDWVAERRLREVLDERNAQCLSSA
jgi:hypothetical protein